MTQYLNQHGYTLWTSYQPGSRFWPFQWIEGGWLFALSVLLIAAQPSGRSAAAPPEYPATAEADGPPAAKAGRLPLRLIYLAGGLGKNRGWGGATRRGAPPHPAPP